MSEGPAAARPSSSERGRLEQRVEELRQRRAQLAAGDRPSVESVNFARQRADEALQRARAAMHGDDGAPHELQEKADRHWQAAHDSHLRSAQDEAKAQDPNKSSSAGSWPSG